MDRTINTKFFTFRQNNSGGYDIINDDVAKYLIIEAVSGREAISKMRDITENYSDYCPCCGERWSDWIDEEDGEEIPMVYGTRVKEEKPESSFSFISSSTIIYYYDGTKEKLWY